MRSVAGIVVYLGFQASLEDQNGSLSAHYVLDCGQLSNPSNGQVFYTITTEGGFADYTCNPGFLLLGVSTRKCLENGSWSDMAPICAGTLTNLCGYAHLCKRFLQGLTTLVLCPVTPHPLHKEGQTNFLSQHVTKHDT